MTATLTSADLWRRKHLDALAPIERVLNALDFNVWIDWSGVVPALVTQGMHINTNIFYPGMEPNHEVGIVSPLGNYELAGYRKWVVYAWDLPDRETWDDDREVSESEPQALLKVLLHFKFLLETHLEG